MSKLPEEFADLERFSDWCLPTEEERYTKRLDSTMAEMQELYDAGLTRLEDIMVYVDARFPLKGMPDDAKALVHLGQSIVMVSFPVEVWKQPRVLDSGAAYIQLVEGAGGLTTVDNSLRASGSSTLTLKAAGYVDVDAGEVIRPGVITIDGDRIIKRGR